MLALQEASVIGMPDGFGQATGSIPVILAVQYEVAEQEMASILFFSTIFSIATMGVFIWLTA